jgi:hypothetical protein
LLVTTLLLTALLPTLLTLLALLTLLTLLTLLLSLLITLLLSLLLTLLITLLLTLLITLLLTVAIAPVRAFIQTASQRVEIVSQLPRAIEVLFRRRTIRTTRTLLSGLQTFRNIIQAALDRAFIAATTTAALLILLTLLLTVIQRLLTFANTIRNTIARQRISRFFQLARGALLTLATASHRPRRLFEILLQTVDAIGQRVFALAELFARLFRVFILRVLTTTTREVLDIFRNLALSRSRLRRALSQLGNLLLSS